MAEWEQHRETHLHCLLNAPEMIPTVPFYEIEIREPDGTVTRGTHMATDDPRAEEWFVEGHYFEHDGRLLRVALLEDAEPPLDQRLVCIPA